MNILIVGSGGREHAFSFRAAQSPLATKVYVAPGNAGSAREPGVENVNLSATDIQGLLAFAQNHTIDLTIVGPEAPLVLGIVDAFRNGGQRIFGPTQAAAQLEGSKTFAKEFLTRHHIPTAAFQSFTDINAALAYVRHTAPPFVVKADGLAAGKGVIIAMTLQEAETAIYDMLLRNVFGRSGHRIIIEEYVAGEEVSFIVMTDGKNILPLATSQDYKRLGDGESGANTGGMGAYSPAPRVTDELYQYIMQHIIWPTVYGMAAEGSSYTGFLYAGLMLTQEGLPKVIEFNCRCGDPETQPLMLRLRSDIVELCLTGAHGAFNQHTVEWDKRAAVGVVLAAKGYPKEHRQGDIIHGLPQQEMAEVKVFHAGTRLQGEYVVTHGGRVLCVTALGDNFNQARMRAYHCVQHIHWPGICYRKDIAYRVID